MDIEEEMIELVLARLQTMPDNFQLNMGDLGTFDKGDLIKHVKDQDHLGKQIVKMQIGYLRALKAGF